MPSVENSSSLSAPPPRRSSGRRVRVLLIVFLVLVLSLGTYKLYRTVDHWTDVAIEREFSLTVENAIRLFQQSIGEIESIMEGARAFHDANGGIGRLEWDHYFGAVSISSRHPELYGIAYVERVPARDRERFIDRVRRDTSTREGGFPLFHLFPETTSDESFILTYVQPSSLEDVAMGFDVSSEVNRYAALSLARDTGKMAMTPSIRLVTGVEGPSIYLPLYRLGQPIETIEQRRSALSGFIVAGLGMPQFFQSVYEPFSFPEGLSLHICQIGSGSVKQAPFYDSISKTEAISMPTDAPFQLTRSFGIGGQTWEVRSFATSEFKRSVQVLPLTVLLGSVLISVLIVGVVTFIVFSSDRILTRERALNDDLHASRQFLNSIIENIPHMIFVKDARDLRFVRFNRAGEDLLGMRREELIGKNDFDFFPKEQATFFTMKDRAVLSHGKLLDIPSETIQTKRRGERILHTKKIPLVDDDGQPRYLLGISEDITERHREERARAEFVTLVSHQLRTPLASMRWSFELLRERFKDASDTESRLFNQVYAAMLNMSETINTMLTVAHIDTRKVVTAVANVSLTGILQSLVREFAVEAKNRNVAVSCDLCEDYRLQSDPNLLREVFSNLIINALQYTPSDGTVTVAVRRDHGTLVVTIADTGIGIPAPSLGMVFEKLFRAENAKSMKPSGSGLGLYVVKKLLDTLGASITATSEQGKGSTFTVRLRG